MTSIAELSCDDSLICDDFDDFESKDLNQMNKTILHYEIMLNKFKNIRDYIHLSYQFPIAKEREVIKNSLDYNNEKGIKFRFTVKKYIVTIKIEKKNTPQRGGWKNKISIFLLKILLRVHIALNI